MAVRYLKQAAPPANVQETEKAVVEVLARIEEEREEAALEYARTFDRWEGDVVVSQEDIARAAAAIPQRVKDDIALACDNVCRFAQLQLDSMRTFETELRTGLHSGQVIRPVQSAGCYVPGGRYAHIASAIMTIATAKTAGVETVTACSPPQAGQGINPFILYAMDYCGADKILAMGGIQAIAAMAFGLFGVPSADVLAGPGNRFVAEAKRLLFGRVGIDVFAGPTEIAIIADSNADPDIVAIDLTGQLEHGVDSPAWLISTDALVAQRVMEKVPQYIGQLPDDAARAASHSWQHCSDVVVCDERAEAVRISDSYAPEHLQVHAADLDWWLENLNNYGSLFLGEETTVAFGDKCSGTNHVLPTRGAARYTGGLSVLKFVKVLTWQRMEKVALPDIAASCARIARLEGMEAHARTADARLRKYFPAQSFDLGC